MHLTNRRWFYLLTAAVTISFLWTGCEKKEKTDPGTENAKTRANQNIKESPEEGFTAPNFTLQNLNGSAVNLADFRGKVVLLNFWASWCGPCKKEIPALKKLYQIRKSPDFEILAVSLDRSARDKVASFVSANQMEFPILLNPDGDIGGRYWVRGIPTSFLLDKKGIIKWKVVGGKEWDGAEVLNRIDQLLSE